LEKLKLKNKKLKSDNLDDCLFNKESNCLALSYAGGKEGNEVTRIMLKEAEVY
jgi:hypothetical protein